MATKNKKITGMQDWDSYFDKKLKSPRQAKIYLDVALEEYEKDGDSEAFLLALRRVAKAQGGVADLAKRAQVNRQNLYKIFSGKRSPRLETLGAILQGLGLRLSIDYASKDKN